IYMLSPEGNVTHWNSGAQKITSYRTEEIIGVHFSLLYTSEERASKRPDEALKLAAEQGRHAEEGWLLRKDGTCFWARPVIESVYDDNGCLLGYTIIARDLTEKKKSEDILRASEKQFRLLIHSVDDDAIYLLSGTGVMTSWNRGAERIKGYTNKEVICTHFPRSYTESHRANNQPMRALEIAARHGYFE